MFISRPHDGVIYFAELPQRGAGRANGLKWSQVRNEPVADGERRIDAGQVPKRIRRAAYRLFERDRKRQLGRITVAPHPVPIGEPPAHPPQRSPGGSPTFHLATGATTP